LTRCSAFAENEYVIQSPDANEPSPIELAFTANIMELEIQIQRASSTEGNLEPANPLSSRWSYSQQSRNICEHQLRKPPILRCGKVVGVFPQMGQRNPNEKVTSVELQ
jgi:hypothetical protein